MGKKKYRYIRGYFIQYLIIFRCKQSIIDIIIINIRVVRVFFYFFIWYFKGVFFLENVKMFVNKTTFHLMFVWHTSTVITYI